MSHYKKKKTMEEVKRQAENFDQEQQLADSDNKR